MNNGTKYIFRKRAKVLYQFMAEFTILIFCATTSSNPQIIIVKQKALQQCIRDNKVDTCMPWFAYSLSFIKLGAVKVRLHKV
jgi:hypothetical protein